MGSNREDGGCRNGVVYRASFLRNNDSRKVGYPIGFNAQRAMHIWDMKGRRRRAPLGHFFCATGALASRALPKPCRRRRALPAGFARFRGRVPWIVSLSPSLFFFPPPLSFPPPSSPLPISHSLFSRTVSCPVPCLRSPFEALGGPRRKNFRRSLRVGCWAGATWSRLRWEWRQAGGAVCPVLLEMGWRRRGANKNSGVNEWQFAILFFPL